jgi:hypothetical protein
LARVVGGNCICNQLYHSEPARAAAAASKGALTGGGLPNPGTDGGKPGRFVHIARRQRSESVITMFFRLNDSGLKRRGKVRMPVKSGIIEHMQIRHGTRI